jgi:hypothetical protein
VLTELGVSDEQIIALRQQNVIGDECADLRACPGPCSRGHMLASGRNISIERTKVVAARWQLNLRAIPPGSVRRLFALLRQRNSGAF